MDVSEIQRACEHLDHVFPTSAPTVVASQNWGSYADAQEAFKHIGSRWDHAAILEHRSILYFLNEAALLFLLPHFVRAVFQDGDVDFDVLSELLHALKWRLAEDETLLSLEQRGALILPLVIVRDHVAAAYDAERHLNVGGILDMLKRES